MLPYAIVRSGFTVARAAPIGVDGDPIELVPFGDLAVACSPNVTRPEVVDADAFLGVIEAIAEVGACLPLRRPTENVSASDLERLIAGGREQLLRRLALVDGCEEWSVRLEMVPGEIRAQNTATGGAAYLEQRRSALAEADGISPNAARLAGELVGASAAWTRTSRLVRCSDGTPALTLLIERAAAEAAIAGVENEARRLGATCTISGPWPAFSFAGSLSIAA